MLKCTFINIWMRQKHSNLLTTTQNFIKTIIHILTLIGKALYYNGHHAQAQQYLETAHMISPYSTEHMPFAVVYERNNNQAELEKLRVYRQMEKASYFTHKAISVESTNVEAYLLRGKIFLQLKRYKKAIHYYRAVQSLANYRFEIYKGLAGCYIGLKCLKDAQTICALAARYFRNCPRSYVLLASTLLYSSNTVTKRQAKTFINRALEVEFYFPAVSAMAEILQSEGETQETIKLLKKQAASYPSCKLFTILGDILSSEKDLDGALEYYTIALSMEHHVSPCAIQSTSFSHRPTGQELQCVQAIPHDLICNPPRIGQSFCFNIFASDTICEKIADEYLSCTCFAEFCDVAGLLNFNKMPPNS